MATLSTNDIKIRYDIDLTKLQQATEQFDKITAEERALLRELGKLKKQLDEVAETAKKPGKTIPESFNKATDSVGNLNSAFSKLGGVLAGIFATSKIIEFSKAVIETTIRFESMRKAIDFASGSTAEGQKNFEFIADTAQRLGLDLAGTADAYKTFASASKLAGQSQAETNRQFAAVAKAAQVMGLSVDDTREAMLALSQMLSKGTVMSEELRGQLGERLVGSFGIAAKAMGVTTAELGKMLEKGQVLAADFLPKFATELENTFGKGNTQVTTLAASQNRFNSSIDKLILAIGERLNPFLKGAYDLAAGIAAEIAKAAGGGGAKKASEDQVALKRVESEIAKETFRLEQQTTLEINARNLKSIRQQIARNQLMGMEARIDAQMNNVANARIAAAGTMNSRLQMNLIKQERELKILQQMEEQYIKIVGVVANAPTAPKPIDPKEIKAAQAALEKEYQDRLRLLELLKQQRILIGELYGDPLAKLGAEEAFLRAKLQLEKEYAAKGVDITKEQIEVTRLARQVAEQEFNQEAERLRMENYKGATKDEKEFLKEREKLIKEFSDRTDEMEKQRRKAYEQSIERETKKFKEAEEIKIAAINLTSTIASGAFELYSASISKQITMLNKRADEEVKLADGNEQKIAEINQKREQRQAELQRKQFEAERAAAIARVVFETAAIIAKWTTVNPVIAGLTLAAQAAQIGFILAQPVPEFAEGTKGKPFEGGLAMVGEKGVEKVVTKSGKVYFTPPTATLVDLPKGSQVIPNSSLSKQEVFWANRLSGGQATANPMVGKLDELGSILKGLPITQLNMDERGFEKYIRTERRTTKILNNRFRSSQ